MNKLGSRKSLVPVFPESLELGELEDSLGLNIPRGQDSRLRTFDEAELANQLPLEGEDIDMTDEALMYEMPTAIEGIPTAPTQPLSRQLSAVTKQAPVVNRNPISGIPNSDRIRSEIFDQKEIDKQAPLAEDVKASDEELMKEDPQAPTKPMSLQDALLRAQGRAEEVSNMGLLAKASRGFLNAGLERAGGKAMEAGVAEDIMKSANRPVDELNQQIEARKQALGIAESERKDKEAKDLRDPNSDVSKQYRDIAKQIGVTVQDNIPAAVIKDQIDLVFKGREADLNRRLKESELALRREDMAAKREDRLSKGAAQEQKEIAKEDRKIRRDLDEAESSLTSKIQQLKDVKKEFEDTTKGFTLGTGPFATLGGTTKFISQDLQKLDTKFNQVGLDEMVKMFSGMSKAVDSNAERAKFESTQPSLTLDDDVNRDLFKTKIEAAESLLKKTREAKKKYDKYGTFDPSVMRQESKDSQADKQPSSAQGQYTPGSIVNYGGKRYRVGSDGDSLEEIQ